MGRKRKHKTSGELESEIARQQIQNKRYHMKVKQSGSLYNRRKMKQVKEYSNEDTEVYQ